MSTHDPSGTGEQALTSTDGWVSIKQAAELSGTSSRTVSSMISSGKVQSQKGRHPQTGRACRLVLSSEVQKCRGPAKMQGITLQKENARALRRAVTILALFPDQKAIMAESSFYNGHYWANAVKVPGSFFRVWLRDRWIQHDRVVKLRHAAYRLTRAGRASAERIVRELTPHDAERKD